MTEDMKHLLRRASVMILFVAAAVAVMTALALRFDSWKDWIAERLSPEPAIPQSQYAPEDFVLEEDVLTCLSGETVVGIDVSHHQQKIDWQKVADSGVQFVMVRLGYRGWSEGRLSVDDYALENLRGAQAAGLQVGAYFYSQALSVEEAEEEARFALEILDGFPLDMPLAFDWEQEERNAGVDAQTVTDCALAFCAAVEEAGYEAMIYFNGYHARQLMQLQRLKDYPWWLAKYDLTTPFPCRFDIWQYTSTGSVPGIYGDVDVNVMVLEESPA